MSKCDLWPFLINNSIDLKWNGVNYLSSIFLIANMQLTSLAVMGPCNFWPFNISFSSSSMDFPLVTKASDTLRLRPPKQIITNSQNNVLKLFQRRCNSNVNAILTVACCNQIGNTTALKECGQFATAIELFGEFNHFHKTQTNNGCFGVVSQFQAINKTSTASNNILQIQRNVNAQFAYFK